MRVAWTRWAGDLTRPAPLLAAAILAVNDHVLKGSGWLPGEVTGKLSDVSGLFVAGIAAVALARGAVATTTGSLPRRDGRLAIAILALVAATFAGLKLSRAFNQAVTSVWGPHVLDASDLWCLPMLLLSLVWLRDRERDGDGIPTRFGSAVACTGVLLVCAATPRAPPVPPPPVAAWSITSQPLVLPCGTARVWVAKSGKTGLGVTVRINPHAGAQTCDATITAGLRFADGTIAGTHVVAKPASELPPLERRDRDPGEPTVSGATYHYLAFEFDNEDRWNRGLRQATLELAIVAGGDRRTWSLPATHAYVEFPVGA